MNKKISVIIPNYNYARFLQRRIDCITNQTIKPSEIIFLDDCSNDDSLIVAKEILSKTDIPYRIVPNETNQGVFKQWLKGIELTQYDYFWIAEADDYCELNFLEILLPAFEDDDVVMSYCDSIQVDEQCNVIQLESEIKNNHFSLKRWSYDFVSSGEDEVKNYLILFNTIPNVSAVLFNKKLIEFSEVKQFLPLFKKAGDWFVYMLVLMQGNNKVAYFSNMVSYFTRHNKSQSVSKDNGIQLNIEILTVYEYMLGYYSFSSKQLVLILKSLLSFFTWCDYNLVSQNKIFGLMNYFPQKILMHELHIIMKRVEHLLIVSRQENNNLKSEYRIITEENNNLKSECLLITEENNNLKSECLLITEENSNLKLEVNMSDRRLIEANELFNKACVQIDELIKSVELFKSELNFVYNSKSWKLSAPLRYINKFIHKLYKARI